MINTAKSQPSKVKLNGYPFYVDED